MEPDISIESTTSTLAKPVVTVLLARDVKRLVVE